LKSLRSSARYAKAKSKSAINLNAHLKKQQKQEEEQHPEKKKKNEGKKKLRQSLSEDQPIYANVDEVIPIHLETTTEVDALMGNAQVRGPNPNPELSSRFSSSICIRFHIAPHPTTVPNQKDPTSDQIKSDLRIGDINPLERFTFSFV